MKTKAFNLVWLGVVLLSLTRSSLGAGVFAWDAELKEANPKPGEFSVPFTFSFTNVSRIEITIREVRTSCGCTTVSLPPLPWKIPTGAHGQFTAVVDISGKTGTLLKRLTVDTTVGEQALMTKITIPEIAASGSTPDRIRNQQLASANRQAVFQGECAKCHAAPALGKSGAALYQAVCSVCHDTPNRASMVPDLALKGANDLGYWRSWIAYGREVSLMPAFSRVMNGPLSDTQVESLAQYLATRPGVLLNGQIRPEKR